METLMTILGGVGTAAVIGSFVWLRSFLIRTDRERKLYWMKVDCMIYALRNINHGIGPDFSAAYDEKLEEMMEAIDFIDNN